MNSKLTEKKPLILIVDDIQKNIQLLGNILKDEIYEIAIAENGRDALDMLEDLIPDLILLDIMMPEIDGFEVCKRLKEKSKTKEIPIIFLTAKTEVEDIVKGFELGAVDYVTKPFNPTELLARVTTHLDLKLARDKEKAHLKEIAEKNEKLLKLDKMKNDLLGMAAHDLRNPIAAINAIMYMILYGGDENLTEEQVEFLKEVEYLGDFMLNLLNDLLDVAAIESGKLTLNMKRHNYIDFVKQNMKFNKLIAEKKNIGLELDIVDEIPEIEFDKDKIGQVLNNLISNAIKFSYSDTKITVKLCIEEDYVLTSVIDQGQGIPEEELPNIFKEFHKSSVRATADEKSTGLGLAITKKVVEGHGGRGGVESEVGKGSTFYFTLPVER